MPIFTPTLNPESLPPIIAQIAALIGIEATELIIKTHAGGPPLYVPIRVTGHGLTELIGEEAARLLAQEYGGQTFRIPKCATAMRETRNAVIVGLRAHRRKLNLIAQETGMSISSVCRILAVARGK